MADIELTLAAPMLLEPKILNPLTAIQPSDHEIDIVSARQVVLKLVDTGSLSQTGVQGNDSRLVSPPIVEKMQRLMDIVAKLRSPDTGWSPDIPQTPETITPYVLEEVEDVLDALQTALPDTEAHDDLSPHGSNPTHWQHYFSLETLEPWLIWCAARSAYATMRLLEGIAATVHPTETETQSGVLRLAMVLQMQTPETTWAIDLVTHQLPPALLSADTLIQTPDYAVCSQPSAVGKLLHDVMNQMQVTTPAIRQFLEGAQIEALIPRHGWQSGCLTVNLGLQFIPNAVDPSINQRLMPEMVIAETVAPDLRSPILAPLVSFTDADWVNRYQQMVVHQQLAQILPHLDSLQRAKNATQPISELVIPLVKDVQTATELLHTSLALSGRNLPQQELGLDELTLRVLWCFNRSADEVMQLMGGLKGKLLQPGSEWQTGSLRLQVILQVTTPELDWKLDLVTGRSPTGNPSQLADDAILDATDSPWCQQPTLVKTLQEKVFSQLHQTTPEIKLLMEGVAVDWLNPDHEWQPGIMHLSVDFEFVPESRQFCLPVIL